MRFLLKCLENNCYFLLLDVFITDSTWSLKEFLALDTVFLFLVRDVRDLTGLRVTTLWGSGCWVILGEGKDCV